MSLKFRSTNLTPFSHTDPQIFKIDHLLRIHFLHSILSFSVPFQPLQMLVIVKLQEEQNEGVLKQISRLGSLLWVFV